MTARSALLSAVRGRAWMKGWATAGKRSVEKKIPEKIHMGTITRFMIPETPSMVRGGRGEQAQPAEGQRAQDRDGGQEQQ